MLPDTVTRVAQLFDFEDVVAVAVVQDVVFDRYAADRVGPTHPVLNLHHESTGTGPAVRNVESLQGNAAAVVAGDHRSIVP
jgi:hypothetical protein